MLTDKWVARVEAIVPLFISDIKIAIDVCETMESANECVSVALSGFAFDGAEAFNIVQHSLALKLASDIARIYDLSGGKSLDKQDKVSIPVLVHHLRKPDVAATFIERAHGWIDGWPDHQCKDAEACRVAIARIVDRWDMMREGNALAPLSRVRDLRTRRLSHNLLDRESDPIPLYSDLFLLMKSAVQIGADLLFAVHGNASGLQDLVDYRRRQADAFWAKVRVGIEH